MFCIVLRQSTLVINMGVAEENCKPFHRGLDINHKEDLKSSLNKFGWAEYWV